MFLPRFPVPGGVDKLAPLGCEVSSQGSGGSHLGGSVPESFGGCNLVSTIFGSNFITSVALGWQLYSDGIKFPPL